MTNGDKRRERLLLAIADFIVRDTEEVTQELRDARRECLRNWCDAEDDDSGKTCELEAGHYPEHHFT